jgi:hypothetical protein
MIFVRLAAAATTMLVGLPLPGTQPAGAPGISVVVPQQVQACQPVQVMVQVDNTGRPAREVVIRLQLRGGTGSPGLSEARLSGGPVPFRFDPSGGYSSPPVRLPANGSADYPIELELSNRDNVGFDLDLQVDLATQDAPTPLAAVVTKLTTYDPTVFAGKPAMDAADPGGVIEFGIDVRNPAPSDFPAATLQLQVDSARRAARMDTLRVDVAEGDGPWRALERSAASTELSFIAPVTRFQPLSAGFARTFRVRLQLDPAQPGAVNPGASLTVTPGDGCPDRTILSGFDLPVRIPDPPPTTSPLPLLIGAVLGAAGTLGGYWLIRRMNRRRSTSDDVLE